VIPPTTEGTGTFTTTEYLDSRDNVGEEIILHRCIVVTPHHASNKTVAVTHYYVDEDKT